MGQLVDIRAARPELAAWVAPLADPETTACVLAERAFSRALGGSCQVPIAGYATLNDSNTFTLRALVASPDGKTVIEKSASGSLQGWQDVSGQVIRDLLSEGAQALIDDAVQQFKG